MKPGDQRATPTITDRSNPRSLKPRAEGRMPAVQETVEQVRRIDVDQYKYGFVTDIESDKAPKGLSRRHRPLHLGQEERAGVDARVAARRLSALADHARADLGARALSEDRLPGSLLLLRAEEEGRPEVARRGRSRNSQDLREARHSAARAGDAAGRAAAGGEDEGEAARLRPRRGRRGVRLRSRSPPPSRRSSPRPA